jgi:peptide/nickel transport system permease protein
MRSELPGLVLRRVLSGLLAVWFAASLGFLLVHLAPGGPAVALAGEHGAPGHLEEVTRAYGLDRPLPLLYVEWLGRLVHGDLGVSYRAQAPVATLIAERAPVTLALMLPALLLASAAGVGLGLATAGLRRGSRWVAGALAGLHAVPSYVVAQLLVLALALGLGWFPVQGLVDAHSEATGLARWAAMAWRLTLPVLALALLQCAFVALLARARVAEELRQPYIATALAKGLSERQARRGHALPNAALPLLTLIGWRFGAIVGGSVVIETLFALPGLGRLAVSSALARDIPTVAGIVVVTCAAVVAVNVAVDLVAAWLDPRVARAAA